MAAKFIVLSKEDEGLPLAKFQQVYLFFDQILCFLKLNPCVLVKAASLPTKLFPYDFLADTQEPHPVSDF